MARAPVVLAIAALMASGCGGDAAGGDDIQVFAAASLTDAFGELAAAYEAANPGVDVDLNIAGSSALRLQILEGAPADVFAAANAAVMDEVVEAGAVRGDPVVFARNRLAIAVPPGNPAGITGLADFARQELFLGLCAAGVPCGDLAAQALTAAGVDPALDTVESDVRALLTKVDAGELDAGIVYVTDVAAADGGVEGVPVPDEVNAEVAYPIAVLDEASDPDGAASFVAFVRSATGRAVLAEHGFGLP